MIQMGRPPKKERCPRRSRTYRLPEDLLAAMEKMAEEMRRPVTTELEIAIEEHLSKAGYWPPKEDAVE